MEPNRFKKIGNRNTIVFEQIQPTSTVTITKASEKGKYLVVTEYDYLQKEPVVSKMTIDKLSKRFDFNDWELIEVKHLSKGCLFSIVDLSNNSKPYLKNLPKLWAR